MGIADNLKKIFRAVKAAGDKYMSGSGNGKSAPERISSESIKQVFEGCYDFEMRDVYPGGREDMRVSLCFIDGLVSGQSVSENIIRPLTDSRRFDGETDEKRIRELMLGGVVYGNTVKQRTSCDEVIKDLLNGFCAVIFDKTGAAVTFEVKSDEKRSIDQPKEEKVVKGSKDAFIEILKTNTSLVRKKLHDPKLKIKETIIGSKSETMAAIIYIDGFTNMEIVEEVEKRLSGIRTEGALTSAVIEENIVDDPRTPFPQLINTERPDKFCLNLLEGRVGIIVDGLPIGYLAPGTFSQFFKVPEDCANHFTVASALTVLRYLALVITLLLPAFYLAVAMYHQETIPTKLIQSMIDAKQSVPFPSAFEVLAMLISFELLQEAGLRLPNPIGETISIIGALIVGQSAVEAKVVSPVVVVVVALSGIAGYTSPNQDMGAALRICRFLFVIASMLGGMFGLAISVVMLLYHLCSLESFGVSYITPFGESSSKYIARAIFRFPMRKMKMREPTLKTGEGNKERDR